MNYKKLSAPALLSCAFSFLCNTSHSQNTQHLFEKSKNTEPYDVIIVPGVPYQDQSMKIILKARILWSKYLYDQHIANNIIYSGASVYTPYVESKIMKTYADSLHIPSAHTFTETQAQHSTENIYYSVLMARKMGFKRIAVATDQYQTVILNMYIKKNCPDVEILTIDFSKIDLITAPWPEIDASCAYVDNFVSLPDREKRGERFKGTLGKNVSFPGNDSTYIGSKTPRMAGIERMVNPLIARTPFLSAIYKPN
ncbi:MAG: YdcF family protein [Bacteroidetes bacterium]|nr:YdcF family protein [Bacteroidota bacterium]